MAGSDLDGDEYVVILDKALFLERNEEAADFTAAPVDSCAPIEASQLQDAMADMFVDYMSKDSVGTIAINLLNNADLFGIGSEVWHKLLDFLVQNIFNRWPKVVRKNTKRHWTSRRQEVLLSAWWKGNGRAVFPQKNRSTAQTIRRRREDK